MGWKADKLQVKTLKHYFQFIHSRIVTEDGKTWNLSIVYASPVEERKKDMWKELTNIAKNMNNGWLVGGDFNDILYMVKKRVGTLSFLRRCTLFQNKINDSDIIDMGSSGYKFTWRGLMVHGDMRIYEKLDSVFCNVN
ncbi:unnamed protein product [Lathyrus sativus]|nr:unnamed protein product [Lathyrus sativus]